MQPPRRIEADDICGVSRFGEGFVFTTGEGLWLQSLGPNVISTRRRRDRWDNHLIKISG